MHKADSLARVSWIERHIGAAGLENCQYGNDHPERAIHENADKSLGSNAHALKMLRQAIGPVIELTVSQLLLVEDQRDCPGCSRYLLVEEQHDRSSAPVSKSCRACRC